jgi:flotillin
MIHYNLAPLIAIAGMVLVVFIISAIWASRFLKVGPNRVLFVSGRLNRLPDGTVRGFRIVKGGGTFVIPVLETTDELSLEVFIIEMPKCKATAAQGTRLEADCRAQVKIKSDDASLVAAAEHFLSKNEAQIKEIVRPVLESHLSSILGNLSREEIDRDPEACAARMQAASSPDLGNMGMALVSFTIRSVRPA